MVKTLALSILNLDLYLERLIVIGNLSGKRDVSQFYAPMSYDIHPEYHPLGRDRERPNRQPLEYGGVFVF
jgi:hypothetical protein